MLTLYLMIGSLILGWISSGIVSDHKKYSVWEWVGIVGLCLIWPYLIGVVLWTL